MQCISLTGNKIDVYMRNQISYRKILTNFYFILESMAF